MSRQPSRRQVIGAGAAALAGGVALAAAPADAHPETRVKKWDHDYDIVVIGLGVAGGSAALEAARAGARVLVLDRGSAAINEGHGSSVYLGGGTPVQKAYKVEDSAEEMEKFILASQSPEPDRERIRIFVERSLPHFQWLLDLGVQFSPDPADKCLIYSGGEDVWPCTEMAKPAMRGHRHKGGATGKAIQRLLTEHLRQAGVPLQLAADCQRLVQGNDGRVQGVIAEIDGKAQSIRARRGVILATGGFAQNRDMLKQHAPLYLNGTPIDVGSNDGWGIRAGQSIGAAVKRMEGVSCFFAPDLPESRVSGILVNRFGQRFIAEESYYGIVGYRIVREQDGVAFQIVDADMLGKRPEIKIAGAPLPHMEEVAARANSIAELEKLLHMPETGLQRQVQAYNEFAAKGQDPFFHKQAKYLKAIAKPPFTALKASIGEAPFSFFTVGGLQTNVKTEVLDLDGTPIPGFHAVGRTAAGILNYPYYVSGLSLGEGTMFGRVAGQLVASTKPA